MTFNIIRAFTPHYYAGRPGTSPRIESLTEAEIAELGGFCDQPTGGHLSPPTSSRRFKQEKLDLIGMINVVIGEYAEKGSLAPSRSARFTTSS